MLDDNQDNTEKTQEKSAYSSVPIHSLFNKFAQERDVSLVYGEVIELNNKKILPVARASYSFGGGSAIINKKDKKSEESGGGGGHFTITPIGVFDITENRTLFKRTSMSKKSFIVGVLATIGVVSFINQFRCK